MKTEQMQTLHPHPERKGKRIALAKYEVIKKNMLSILKNAELTHTELMEQLHDHVKAHFEGNAQWYGETVKLDLEARKIVERTGKKPDTYRLVKKKR